MSDTKHTLTQKHVIAKDSAALLISTKPGATASKSTAQPTKPTTKGK
jgi:hypothetical protein